MKRAAQSVAIVVSAAALSACVVGPDYQRPAVEVPTSWRFNGQVAQTTANVAWWEQFGDQQLNAMIQEALQNNQDVRIAASRVAEFRAALHISESNEYPQATYDLHNGRQRLSQNEQVPLPVDVSPYYYGHAVAADAMYEVDLWGRVRRSTEAALGDLLSVEENQRSVILTLVSSVATAYVQLLSLDKELQIAKDTLANRTKSLELAKDKVAGGDASELELAEVQALYQETAAAIPDLERRISEQENALSQLMGRNPGDIARGDSFDTLSMPAVPGGVPSDILAARPDVRAAEQLLVAANARIGVAKAEYFPALTLTSQYGFSSSELVNWLHGSSEVGEMFGANITGSIFSGGKISADVARAKAITEGDKANYLKTVQQAFVDVDNALVAHQKYGQRSEAIDVEVEAWRKFARLAQGRYEGGYSSYIEVLYAQRNLYGAEISQVEARRDIYTALVSLYKATGGGWPISRDPIDSGTGAVDPPKNSVPAPLYIPASAPAPTADPAPAPVPVAPADSPAPAAVPVPDPAPVAPTESPVPAPASPTPDGAGAASAAAQPARDEGGGAPPAVSDTQSTTHPSDQLSDSRSAAADNSGEVTP